MTERIYDRHVLGMCIYTAAHALTLIWAAIQ